MAKLSVILPVYRTAAYLRELYGRLKQTLESIPVEFELIFLDDGSPDDAWSTILELGRQDPRVVGLKMSRNFGQHPAIAAGLEQASGELLVLMDTDLQDRPEDIPALLEAMAEDVDIIYTTKSKVAESLLVRATSALYHYVFSRLTQSKVPRNIGTLRLFTRRVRDAMQQYSERHVVYGPLMFAIGFNSKVLEVVRDARKDGSSSYSFSRRLALAFDSLISYTDLPHRLLLTFGGLVEVMTVLYLIALVVRYYYAAASIPSGLTLIASLISLSLGALMMGLGIIGLYLFRVYEEVLRRPRYLLARTVNC